MKHHLAILIAATATAGGAFLFKLHESHRPPEDKTEAPKVVFRSQPRPRSAARTGERDFRGSVMSRGVESQDDRVRRELVAEGFSAEEANLAIKASVVLQKDMTKAHAAWVKTHTRTNVDLKRFPLFDP